MKPDIAAELLAVVGVSQLEEMKTNVDDEMYTSVCDCV